MTGVESLAESGGGIDSVVADWAGCSMPSKDSWESSEAPVKLRLDSALGLEGMLIESKSI